MEQRKCMTPVHLINKLRYCRYSVFPSIQLNRKLILPLEFLLKNCMFPWILGLEVQSCLTPRREPNREPGSHTPIQDEIFL